MLDDKPETRRWRRVRGVGVLILTAGMVAACQGAGASDVVGGGGLANCEHDHHPGGVFGSGTRVEQSDSGIQRLRVG